MALILHIAHTPPARHPPPPPPPPPPPDDPPDDEAEGEVVQEPPPLPPPPDVRVGARVRAAKGSQASFLIPPSSRQRRPKCFPCAPGSVSSMKSYHAAISTSGRPSA